MSERNARALDVLRRAAEAAFGAEVTWHQALVALSEARRATRKAKQPGRPPKGCPSEAAYRRHLRSGEKCQPCRDRMHRIELERRAKHPEWWVRGAGKPVTT